jgi:hypothetical protein
VGDPRYIHIRNWDRFQHYKNRGKITWIKDYGAQLSDDDWLTLTFAQRGLLQGLRLLYASRSPLGIDQTVARNTLCTNQGDSSHFARNLEALNHAGLVVLSSSKRLDDSAKTSSPEEETEREEEKNQEHDQNPSIQPSSRTPPEPNGNRERKTDGWMDETNRITIEDLPEALRR